MRTVLASAGKPRKSALRINKQESRAAVLVPRGLAALPPAAPGRQLSAEDLRHLSIGEFTAWLREGVSKRNGRTRNTRSPTTPTRPGPWISG